MHQTGEKYALNMTHLCTILSDSRKSPSSLHFLERIESSLSEWLRKVTS